MKEKKEQTTHTKDSIDATVVLGIIRYLSILSKNHLSTRRDKPKLRNIDLNDGSFCHDAELGVHWGLRVLLDSKDLELEGCF
jgi:hypothetical protein